MKLIGLSLSFCIKDIVEGKVSLDDVQTIITGTNFSSRSDFLSAHDEYHAYWKDNPHLAWQTLYQLWDSGRIVQPRRSGQESCNIAAGWWIDLDRDEAKTRAPGKDRW